MREEVAVTPEVDGILEAYVRGVESLEDTDIPEEEKTIDIILTLGGMVISGELISYKTFYRDSIAAGRACTPRYENWRGKVRDLILLLKPKKII